MDTGFELILTHDVPLLKKLVGSSIEHATLDIWPSPTWPDDTDTRLNLGVYLPSGDLLSLTFKQTSSGASEIVEEHLDSEISYDKLDYYVELWKNDEFWEKDDPTQRLRVSLDGETQFGRLLGSRIVFVELVFFYPEMILLGYLIGLQNGNHIWSTPCTDGNSISAGFSRKYIGSESTIKIRIDETTL